ncbi:MAG: hypothetical protein CL846_06325 [Crocinitomicaceae bacterium]|nr:hypothetical protein [Crocinitomicaceae bacterium]|tara:strand:- start:4193 stop:4699 length:507 start_codon:yes stop_codon:yes gene_type:complete
MKQLFSVVLFFCILHFTAQDSLRIHNDFYKTQENAMKILGGWSAINIASSPFLKTTSTESWSHFHQMNFNWNLVNISIAGFGYMGLKKRKEKYWSLNSLEMDRNKLKKSLAVNMGLDAAYMVFGAVLKNRSLGNPLDLERNIGFGNSIILQGGFLFVFDGVFLLKNRH